MTKDRRQLSASDRNPLIAPLDKVLTLSHNFGYGVGVDTDYLLTKYVAPAAKPACGWRFPKLPFLGNGNKGVFSGAAVQARASVRGLLVPHPVHPDRYRRGRLQFDLQSPLRLDYFIGPHHFVVLVLQNMAVPNVTTRIACKWDDDSRDHSWISSDRVLPAGLSRLRRYGTTSVADNLLTLICKRLKSAPIKNLKTHQVKMNRMCIVGDIQEVPDLH
jgi:hypothetical protein